MNKEQFLQQQKEFEEYKGKIVGAYVESWYEELKDHTFQTVFIPVSNEEADSLIKSHLEYKKSGSIKIYQNLEKLKQNLDSTIKNFGKAFVKTSSRSPKDVITNELENKFKEVINSLSEDKKNDNCMRYALLAQLATDLLKVTDATQVLNIFIKSSRVYEDLVEAQEFQTKEFKFSFIVREWYEGLHVDMEFRCFIYNGKMNAISQYNYL